MSTLDNQTNGREIIATLKIQLPHTSQCGTEQQMVAQMQRVLDAIAAADMAMDSALDDTWLWGVMTPNDLLDNEDGFLPLENIDQQGLSALQGTYYRPSVVTLPSEVWSVLRIDSYHFHLDFRIESASNVGTALMMDVWADGQDELSMFQAVRVIHEFTAICTIYPIRLMVEGEECQVHQRTFVVEHRDWEQTFCTHPYFLNVTIARSTQVPGPVESFFTWTDGEGCWDGYWRSAGLNRSLQRILTMMCPTSKGSIEDQIMDLPGEHVTVSRQGGEIIQVKLFDKWGDSQIFAEELIFF